MELTKNQWIKLSNIFHEKFDAYQYPKVGMHGGYPTSSFGAVVQIVEEFLGEMSKQPPIDSLPVEDVVTIENYKAFLKQSPDVTSISFRLSDGETIYTLNNEL